jgi:hypothetical protein
VISLKETLLSPKLQEISKRMKVIYFGTIIDRKEDPWEKINGMFKGGGSIDVEEALDAKGFQEAELHLRF